MIDMNSKYNRDAIETLRREQGLGLGQARRAIFRIEFKRQLQHISAAEYIEAGTRVEMLCDLLLQAMEGELL